MANSKSENQTITFMYLDDWEAVYLDDELIFQDHTIDAFDLLNKLIVYLKVVIDNKTQLKYHYITNAAWQKFKKIGRLPDSLQEIWDVENNVKGDYSI